MPNSLVEQVFYAVPLPIFGIVLLFALSAAVWGGVWARRLWQARLEKTGKILIQEEHVVGASLGLLTLLLGFTFSMAVDRHDLRRTMVTEEANAISTTYLITQTFEEPDRSRISRILVDYIDQRIVVAQENNPDKARALIVENNRLKSQFWAAALSATSARRDDIASAFLQAGNRMLEVARQREGARRAFIPVTVHLVTILFLLTAAAILGSAHKEGTPRVSVAMLLLLTMTMLLIIDLDRPNSGQLRESQRSMELLRDDLRTNTPEDFERLRGFSYQLNAKK